MNEDEIKALKVQLVGLRQEHRDLDIAIARLQEAVYVDSLQVQRMKKRKLRLKERIADLEDKLIPDIIA